MNKMHRGNLIVVLPVLLMAACSKPVTPEAEAPAVGAAPDDSAATPVATLTLSNPSEFARPDEATVLDVDALGVAPGASYRATIGGIELPSQPSDTDGDGEIDALVFITEFSPAESKTVEIVAAAATTPARRTQAEVSIKKGGEWDGKVYKGGTFVNVDSVDPPPQFTGRKPG